MTGILVPIVVTFLVLRLVFRWLDGLAQPIIRQLFQTQGDIPGLGIVLTLILIAAAWPLTWALWTFPLPRVRNFLRTTCRQFILSVAMATRPVLCLASRR